MKKILNSLLCLVLTVLSLNVNTTYALENQITAKNTEKTKITYNEINDYFTYLKLTDDNYYIYCIEYNKVYAPGQVLSNAQNGDAGVAYIIANGLNGKLNGTATENIKRAYYETQLAIHVYLGQYTIKENSDLKTKIMNTVEKAKEYKALANKNLTVSAKTNSNEMTLKKDYYVSNAIVINSSRSDAKVKLATSNGEVVNKSGKIVNEVNDGETVYVRIKKDDLLENTEVKLTLESAVTNYTTTNFYPSSSKNQPVAYSKLGKDEKNDQSSLTLNTMKEEVVKNKVKISKQDMTTKEELAGATLVIKDKDGKEIEKWVSTNEPHYVELEKGIYTLTETQAPDGYMLSDETITFEVNEDGTVDKDVVMYNTKAVNVPITSSNASIIIMGLGVLGLIVGARKVVKNVF